MRDIPIIRPGDDITADWANAIRARLMALRVEADPSSGLESRRGPYGTTLRIGALPAAGGGGGAVGQVAAGGLGPATSITAPGTGSAILYDYSTDPPSAGATVGVKNPYQVQLPAGTTVILFPAGPIWVLVSAECSA